MREIAQRTDGELIVATAVQQVGVWDATLTLQVMEKEEEMAQQYLGDKVGNSPPPGARRSHGSRAAMRQSHPQPR